MFSTRNWKIGTKLTLGFVAIALIFILNSVVNAFLISSVDRSVMNVVDEYFPSALKADKMGDDLLRLQQLFVAQSTQPQPDPATETEVKRLSLEFQELAGGFSSTFRKEGDSANLKLVAEIQELFQRFVKENTDAVAVFRHQGMEKGHEKQEKNTSILEELEERIERLRTGQTELAHKAANDADDTVDLMRVVMAITGLGALATCLLVIVFVRRGVVLPLRSIASLAARIAEGETNLRVNIPGNDEIAELSRTLDHLLERIGKSLALNHAVLNAVPDPIFMTGEDDTVMLANAAAVRLANVAGGSLVGQNCKTAFKAGVCGTPFNPSSQAGMKLGIIECRTLSGPVFFQPHAVAVYDEGHNTIGFLEVARDVTEMVLQEREVAKHLERMRHVNFEADSAAQLIAEATDNIAAQMGQVSLGATAQTNRIALSVEAMEQISSKIGEVAGNASRASQLANQAREKARQGATVVSSSVEAIANVQSLSGELRQSVSSLGVQAESIGRIINVISDIADQTNLLALNAAIEAARAGEAGRGFAVVADEVRKLAEKTMSATQEVGQAVKLIQNGVGTNIDGMEKASSAIQHAAGLAVESGQALEEIVPLVEATSAQVNMIAHAAEEQAVTSDTVNRNIQEVDAVSREIASGMALSAKATTDLAAMAHKLKDLAEHKE